MEQKQLVIRCIAKFRKVSVSGNTRQVSPLARLGCDAPATAISVMQKTLRAKILTNVRQYKLSLLERRASSYMSNALTVALVSEIAD